MVLYRTYFGRYPEDGRPAKGPMRNKGTVPKETMVASARSLIRRFGCFGYRDVGQFRFLWMFFAADGQRNFGCFPDQFLFGWEASWIGVIAFGVHSVKE